MTLRTPVLLYLKSCCTKLKSNDYFLHTLLHKPTCFSQIALSRNVHQGHTPAPEQRGLFNQLLWRDPARRHQLRPSQLLSSSTALHAEVAGHSCCFWHSFDSVFLVSRRQKERNLPGSAFPRLHIFEPLQSRVGPERHLSCSRSLVTQDVNKDGWTKPVWV